MSQRENGSMKGGRRGDGMCINSTIISVDGDELGTLCGFKARETHKRTIGSLVMTSPWSSIWGSAKLHSNGGDPSGVNISIG